MIEPYDYEDNIVNDLATEVVPNCDIDLFTGIRNQIRPLGVVRGVNRSLGKYMADIVEFEIYHWIIE